MLLYAFLVQTTGWNQGGLNKKEMQLNLFKDGYLDNFHIFS